MASRARAFAVVLAAGTSQRLGRPKQLLELDGKPLVTHVVERALESDVDGVVVVTGSHASEVDLELRNLPIYRVFHPHFAEGQGSSLAAGARSMPSTVDALVVLLADMPGIQASDINAVVERWRTARPAAVVTRYTSGRGHPVLFDRAVFAEIRALEGDTGGREILRRLGDRVAEVVVSRDAPPQDVDTEDDWQRLQLDWNANR